MSQTRHRRMRWATSLLCILDSVMSNVGNEQRSHCLRTATNFLHLSLTALYFPRPNAEMLGNSICASNFPSSNLTTVSVCLTFFVSFFFFAHATKGQALTKARHRTGIDVHLGTSRGEPARQATSESKRTQRQPRRNLHMHYIWSCVGRWSWLRWFCCGCWGGYVVVVMVVLS